MRLFVALNPPDAVRRELWKATAPLRSAGLPVRWVAAEGLHLTLKFLGEVPGDQETAVRAALDQAVLGMRAFEVSFTEFGAFPDVKRPRVVWAGLAATPPLELLHDAIERAMSALGFEPEGRIFKPHVTLGRSRRDGRPGDFRDLASLLDRLAFGAAFVAEQVDLMESVLRREGATYLVRHSVSFREASAP